MAPAPISGAPIAPESLGPRLQAGLCLIQTIVRSPDYRITMREATVEAKTEAGLAEVVDARKISKSKWIWNIHPIFDEIDANKRAIGDLLNVYSVPDRLTESASRGGGGGIRLMPMHKFPEFDVRRRQLIEARRGLVERLADLWWAEVVPGLSEYFGPHFYQVRPCLPSGPNDLQHRYEVACPPPLPLTPIDAGAMDITALTPDERDQFVRGQKEQIERMFRERFAAIFDSVLGGIHALCLDITQGPVDEKTGRRTGRSAIQTGKRKSGCIDEILNLLDRAVCFKDVTRLTPEVLDLIRDARAQLAEVSIVDLNSNQGDNPVTAGIKTSMGQLGVAVKRLWDHQTGRARRSISI